MGEPDLPGPVQIPLRFTKQEVMTDAEQRGSRGRVKCFKALIFI